MVQNQWGKRRWRAGVDERSVQQMTRGLVPSALTQRLRGLPSVSRL